MTSERTDRADLERALLGQRTEDVALIARYATEPFRREVALQELNRRETIHSLTRKDGTA